MRYGDTRLSRQAASIVVSQTRSFIEIQPAGPSGFIAARFCAWGASQFFRMPVSEFADQMVTAVDIWGREAMVLEESIANARSMSERVRHVQAFLIQQLRCHQQDSVEALIRHVGSTRGRSRVAPITGLARGQDVARLRRVVLEFSPQFGKVSVDGPRQD